MKLKRNGMMYFSDNNTSWTDGTNVTTSARTDGNAMGATLNHTILEFYSREMRFQYQPQLRFGQFATKKTDLMVTPGLSMTFTKYNNVTGGGALSEDTPMATTALTSTQKSIVVTEYGKAVGMSELLIRTSMANVMRDAVKLLGMNYRDVTDAMLMNALLTGNTNVIYAGSVADRQALKDAVTLKLFDSALIKDAIEVLETNNVPKFNGEYWVCIIHPHQARGLKDDADFKLARDYKAVFSGEIGRLDDIVFVATTNMPIITTSGKNDVYQAVMFGDNAYAWAIALPAELRDNGVIDFGRTRQIAWYAIQGSARIDDECSVVLESN